MRYFIIIGCLFGWLAASAVLVYATPFTPLEWRQEIKKHSNQTFIGQRKLTNWVRDKNGNFIDDIIDRRLGVFGNNDISVDWHELPDEAKRKKFNIIVDLNTFLTLNEIRGMLKDRDNPDMEREYGDLKYICKTITSVFLDNVKAINLPKIAKMPEVAMIEFQHGFQPALDISTRAVQAKATTKIGHPYRLASAAEAGWTGNGVAIAIIDTGVDDDHEQLAGKYIAGFDATKFEEIMGDDDTKDKGHELANACTNPDDDFGEHGHGTLVAGIALGKGVNGADCGTPEPEDAAGEVNNCQGVAPGARLVDIKVCDPANLMEPCPHEDVSLGLDWLALNFDKLPLSNCPQNDSPNSIQVRVANLSLVMKCSENDSDCDPNQPYQSDGKGLLPQQVNYLSALGVVMVAAHGNSWNIGVPSHTELTPSPGSASFAITVSASQIYKYNSEIDQTLYYINRANHTFWENGHLLGPRVDYVDHLDPLALKPDISAPGEFLRVPVTVPANGYGGDRGTSLAAPHVSGAAAILLEKDPGMNPGDVKDALKRSADINQNKAYNIIYHQHWDQALGSGMLNVWGALKKLEPTDAESADVGFPACSGPPDRAGRPCRLAGGLPSWNNYRDIDTQSSPEAGNANQIHVWVQNSGPNPATFLVNFGVYPVGVGNNKFFHIGSKQETLMQNETKIVSHPWTPSAFDHQCVQVSIDYGPDTNYDNNITQRNLIVLPSASNIPFMMSVENPFAVPATFRIEPKSLRKGWDCKCAVLDREFKLHPYRDPPRKIQITFAPPKDAKPGDRANCDVSVYAKQEGTDKEELIGGVTLQTFVPKN